MADRDWAELHGGVEVKGFIKYWILISKVLAKPFIFLRISPNQISILAILISIPFIFYPTAWWLVIVGLILDGIDGRVALDSKRATKFGGVVDAISDRVVEFMWAFGLYMLGLNFALIGLLIGFAWVQEYLRARAGGLGFRKIGVVTIGERPTRAIFIALISLVANFSSVILIIAVIVQAISLLTLIYNYEKEINQ